MEIEEEAQKYIRRYVLFGFYSSIEIERIVGDDVFAGEIPKKRLRAMIKAEIEQKRIEEQSWPAVTDCDRLDQVFALLESEKILALHNAGLTPSEGIDEMSERYYEAGGRKSGISGYCFYHGQDMESALVDDELGLAFGDIKGDDTKGVKIGERIRRALEAGGLKVAWTGSIKDKMFLKGFRWQRRTKTA
jgi:hypothetical protein